MSRRGNRNNRRTSKAVKPEVDNVPAKKPQGVKKEPVAARDKFTVARVTREVAPDLERVGVKQKLPPVKRVTEIAKPVVKRPTPTRSNAAHRLRSRAVVREKELPLKRERPHCKPRPVNNRGDGSSRKFVPWCNKRK
jgi:hypothetical protein